MGRGGEREIDRLRVRQVGETDSVMKVFLRNARL